MQLAFNEYRTERLILRELNAEVMKTVYETLTEEEQMEVLCIDSKEELAKNRSKYERGLTTHNRSFKWFLLIDKSSGLHVGTAGYHIWYTDHNRAEIGYSLNEDRFKNQGYMSETLDFLIPFGFKEMNLHRIEAFVGPKNTPSLRLMERFGFVQEGHLKEHYLRDGVYEDSLVFGLIRPGDFPESP